MFNQPIRPWRFCRKTRFEASRAFFWSLSGYKDFKLTTKPFPGRKLGGLLMQMQNISFRSSASFILIEKIWGVGGTLRILGLDERKGRWVVGQDFQGNFWVNVTWLPFSPASLTDSCLFWYGFTLRSLHPAQVSWQSCPWPLKLMTSQAVEGTWVRRSGRMS